MKEWSLISCQVFFNLIRHYRRKCRAVNCDQCVLEKNVYFINDISPHFKILSNERLDLCEFL